MKEHVYWSGSLGMGCWEFRKSSFTLKPGFMPPPPDCTCVVEHLLQGDSNMGFSWHPFCWFQKYKLACVGSRLGAALLSSLSFCSFIFHSSCQESLFFPEVSPLLSLPSSFIFFFPSRSNYVFPGAFCCFLSSYTLTLPVPFICALLSLI